MPNEPMITRAGPSDVADVLALWALLDELQEPLRGFPTDTDRAARAAASLDELITRDDAAVLIARLDDRAVGTAVVEIEPKAGARDVVIGSIGRVVVAPTDRRSGIGSALVARAEEAAIEGGATHLAAKVFARNEAGGRFWVARGFRPRVVEYLRPILADEEVK